MEYGIIISTLIYSTDYLNIIEKNGIFSSEYNFSPLTTEVMLAFCPFVPDELTVKKLPLKNSLEKFTLFEDPFEKAISRHERVLDQAFHINKIGTAEIVNNHQWHARQPMDFKKNGYSYLTEPPLWDIATPLFDERLLLACSHNYRDDLYIIMNRINMFIDYWKDFRSHMIDDIEEANPNKEYSIYSYEDEERQEKMKRLYDAILDEYRENPPPWENL